MHRQLRGIGGSIVAGALVMALAGCGTETSISNAWRDPNFQGPLVNWIVFGTGLDVTHRHVLEDGFVNALTARGVRATPSYRLFPDPLPERDAARAAVQKASFDGILVASNRGVQERLTVVPGAYAGGFWGGYYGTAWGPAPGYVTTEQFVNFETTVWSAVGDGKLIWAATTKTENPTSGQDFVRSLTEKMVPALSKAGLLPLQAQ